MRGGITVDMAWSRGRASSATLSVDSGASVRQRPVQVVYAGRILGAFTASSGVKRVFTNF